jgi:hypothetical protein
VWAGVRVHFDAGRPCGLPGWLRPGISGTNAASTGEAVLEKAVVKRGADGG